MRTLDRIDADILRALQNQARLSNKELAARVGLAPSSCLERVRRLQEEGAFRGFHADVDPKILGVGLEAMVAIRLARHARGEVEGFQQHANALPEVVALYHLTGAADYLVHLAVRDLDHLREVLLSAFTTRAEVDHMETSVIFRHTRKWGYPLYSEGEG